MISNPPSESDSALATRVAAHLLALLGLYPQYRAVSSIWLGWTGSPHWAPHDEVNRRFIYIIEPVVESLLQLFCQSIILYVFIGPGEGMDQGQFKKNKLVNSNGQWLFVGCSALLITCYSVYSCRFTKL